MSNDTTVPFLNLVFRDEMTDLIRAHAQTAIREAVLAELEAFLGRHADADSQGRRHVVRNPVCQHPVQQSLIGFICNIQGANGVETCLIPMKSSPIRDWKNAPVAGSA